MTRKVPTANMEKSQGRLYLLRVNVKGRYMLIEEKLDNIRI